MARLLGDIISVAEVELAMATSPLVRAELIDRATKARDYWRSIAPVGTHEHTLKSGHVDKPGDYRDSIQIEYRRLPNGVMAARIVAKDYKAAWIEYGSKHMPEYAPRAKTAAQFGATGGSDSAD